MKFTNNKKLAPGEPEFRIISRFLYFPKCFGGEWRWLEEANIVQFFSQTQSHGLKPGWNDIKWGQKDEN